MENQENTAQNTDNRKTILSGLHPNDGTVVITFSDDNLEAWADFIPPMAKGQPLDMDYVTDALKRFNITSGVLWDAVRDALAVTGETGRPKRQVLIARGEKPVSEEAEYFRFNPELEKHSLPGLDVLRVDYRDISPYIMVNKDQVIASKQARIAGKKGTDVHGMDIPFTVIRHETVRGGNNTVSGDEDIRAGIDGRLIRENGVLSVDEVLVIKGQVGYATGHVNFPGDVIIDGPVADGFKVYSGGSVLVKQTFDVTELNAKKDLNVAGGLIGRGKALVKTGGALRARFIRNCHVASRETVLIDSEIFNSSIFSLQRVELGDRGRITGGDIYAIHGIKAAHIGTQSGRATRLHCGIDFTVVQEKEKLNLRLRILVAKLQKLLDFIAGADPASEQKKRMDELALRLEEEIDKITARISDLMDKVNADEHATVDVSGEIAGGTLVEICAIAYVVEHNLKRVRIRLDKAQGKLVHEMLK
ncbi:MAG: FapA family protein [Spirochaetaceae bacterium]|jgi:uncharacterized protein (DUF342 family)|nr:FapA family protein [Spirochaetaceae bacterium]